MTPSALAGAPVDVFDEAAQIVAVRYEQLAAVTAARFSHFVAVIERGEEP